MADEILRSRHAFGSEAAVDQALLDKKIDAHDILFLDEGKIGWIKKDGTKFILEDREQVVPVSELPEVGDTKTIYIYNGKFYYWDGEKYSSPECDGVDEEVLNTKVEQAVVSANSYTDSKLETVMAKKYEFTDLPVGTLVDYSDHEVRVMCPANTVWTKQAVGVGGDANSYYGTFRVYAPCDEAVGYIEHLGDQVDSEILTTFSTDEYGRRYQPIWLAFAKYDESTDSWTYYGASSSKEKYIGWDYQIDWFNADGVMIASDSIRINLANEECYSSVTPYYVSNFKASATEAANAYTDEKIAALESAYTIVEF